MAGFIISTGRCGSTLLSRLLRDHPAILSLSEFFGMLQSPDLSEAFPESPLTGEQFWSMLATPRPEIASVKRPCAGMPPLLAAALPRLTDDAEALHEELGGYIRTLPRADCGTQYSQVFGWLGRRFGCREWVERSGGSTWFLADILRYWPTARYVHLVRDGRNVAISMSKRPGFRLAVLADQLQLKPGRPQPVSRGRLATAADAIAVAGEIPLERFGEMWARQVLGTHEQLAELPPGQVLLIRYEDLAEDPGQELARLASFLDPGGEIPRGWLHEAAGEVQRNPPAAAALAGPERARLDAACGPGLQLLGYQ